jgi:formate dehydrogenase maturation protein FdhE
MHLDPHVAIAAVVTLAAGWLMMVAGLQKSALEQKRRRRVCPSCGKQIQARVCTGCSS